MAVQAQDLRSARLAVRARSTGLTAADVDAALNDRTLVVTWLLRATLHLVRADDLAWLHAGTRHLAVAAGARRLAQLGVTPAGAERALAALERALADRGPLTRAELEPHLGTSGQATPHLLGLAARRGLVVLGPVTPHGHAFALTREWLGPQRPPDREAALRELARRHLRGHAPAAPEDLARWSGVALGDARRAFVPGRPRTAAAPAAPRLLGAFDPLLLGWRDRPVGAEHARVVHPGGGIIRPTVLVGGWVAGTWRRGRDGGVEVAPFAPLAPADAAALEAEAADVARFEGGGGA